MNEELEYTLNQSRRTVESELQKVAEYVKDLQDKIAQGDWSNPSDWTDGYVTRDIAKVIAGLAQQQALATAARIVGKE